jgi:hypothetical protein
MAECLETAGVAGTSDCDVVVFAASMGHDFEALGQEASDLASSARVLGSSCCGVVGSEGVSESMNDLAVMTISGAEPGELAVAQVDGIYGHNSQEKAAELAADLKAQAPEVSMVLFLASGIDIDDDACIAGLESVLGDEVTIFGATSADNMRGVVSYQVLDREVFTHSAWAVGFADPTLAVVTAATHGFVAIGEPMIVTASEQNRIIELDDRPAWSVFTERLGLPADATPADTIPIGALAERLPADLAAEYGNPDILRVVTKRDDDGTMHYATTCPVGTELRLTVRDEDLIFNDLDRMMERIIAEADGAEVIAVFHADCLARGRSLFGRVLKEELVGQMQYPLARDGVIPPWLGMYGFGEFARLGGANTYHNYTTAIYALVRRGN